jgi:hypothetical protein
MRHDCPARSRLQNTGGLQRGGALNPTAQRSEFPTHAARLSRAARMCRIPEGRGGRGPQGGHIRGGRFIQLLRDPGRRQQQGERTSDLLDRTGGDWRVGRVAFPDRLRRSPAATRRSSAVEVHAQRWRPGRRRDGVLRCPVPAPMSTCPIVARALVQPVQSPVQSAWDRVPRPASRRPVNKRSGYVLSIRRD